MSQKFTVTEIANIRASVSMNKSGVGLSYEELMRLCDTYEPVPDPKPVTPQAETEPSEQPQPARADRGRGRGGR